MPRVKRGTNAAPSARRFLNAREYFLTKSKLYVRRKKPSNRALKFATPAASRRSASTLDLDRAHGAAARLHGLNYTSSSATEESRCGTGPQILADLA